MSRKNIKKYELTQVICHSSFFKTIKKFLDRNIKNKVVFMGEFYDRGPYVMDVIINISMLKSEYKDRVVIVLGYADFQKYRFKYELDKDLLKLNKIKWS